QRTERRNVTLAQAQLFVDEAQHRLEIIEAAQAGDALDAPRHDIRIGQLTDREMAARRMPGDINLLRIATVFADMGMDPGNRGAALADLLGHRDAWNEIVIDDDGEKAGAAETERDVGAVLLVVADPIAAVDIDLHGLKPAFAPPKNSEPSAGAPPIRPIDPAGMVSRTRALCSTQRARCAF